MSYTIRTVSFNEDGVDITYMSESDVRADGAVFQSHHLSLSRDHEELSELVSEVEEAAEDLLGSALRLWSSTDVVNLKERISARLEELDDE